MGNYKKVTSKDVARLAGVSQSTVSMVLNNSETASFSEGTVQRVFTAAKELGYSVGRKRSKIRTPDGFGILLIVCPSVTNPYYASIVHTIAFYAQAQGLLPMFFDTFRDPRNESRVAEAVKNLSVSGLICLGAPAMPDAVYHLAQQVPMVIIDDKQDNPCADLIELDGVKVGTVMGRHLLSLGHRTAAYLSPSLKDPRAPQNRRLEGLRAAWAEAGLPPDQVVAFDAEDDLLPGRTGSDEYMAGFRLSRRAAEHPGITAMAGFNDMVAYGILDSLLDLGYHIPQDYSICGCDNILFSNMRGVGLTTVEHFAAEKARDAVDILVRRMGMGAEGETPPRTHRVEYEPQLIVRSSTGASRPADGK